MRLDELAPVGRRPASWRGRRGFERFAEVRENLPNRPGLDDERNEPDIAAAGNGMAIRVGGRFLCAASVWSMNVAFAGHRGSSNLQPRFGPSVKCCPTVPLASEFKSFSGLTAITR